MHARFVDFDHRDAAEVTDVNYFVEKYATLLKFSPQQLDQLYDEFIKYQLLSPEDIPVHVWSTAKQMQQELDEITDEQQQSSVHTRMDVIWAFLSKMKSPDGCTLRFPNLTKIAQVVLILPHSNASEERIFSLIRLNKTSYRSSLSNDGTLSSILTVKMHNPEPCYKFEPSSLIMDKAKKATKQYNLQFKNN